MASPKIIEFAVFNASTGAPLTGQAGSMTFSTYKDETGANVTPQPTIIEIGGGLYYFTPSFASPSHGIAYVINTGAGATPAYVSGYIRPEDFNTDNIDVASSALSTSIAGVNTAVGGVSTALAAAQLDITILKKIGIGKWQVHSTGPDQNKLVIYDTDNVTPLYKFDLFDKDGNPAFTNPFKRVPA